MENKKNENLGSEIKNALMTIISVLVYIIYKLSNKIMEVIKHPVKEEAFPIVGVVLLIIAAIVFWPVSLAVIITLILFFLGIFGPGIFD